MEANAFPGPAVVIAYSPCMPEHGIGDDRAAEQAKLAVESRAFPLFVYDPRKGERMKERFDLKSNPALKEDWYVNPKTNQPVDFIAFARTEGRFRRHFDAFRGAESRAGRPLEELAPAARAGGPALTGEFRQESNRG